MDYCRYIALLIVLSIWFDSAIYLYCTIAKAWLGWHLFLIGAKKVWSKYLDGCVFLKHKNIWMDVCFSTQEHIMQICTCVILCVFEHKNEYLFVYVQLQNSNVCLQNNDVCAKLLHYYLFFARSWHICAKRLCVCRAPISHSVPRCSLPRNNFWLSRSLGGAANKKCNQSFLTNATVLKWKSIFLEIKYFVRLHLFVCASPKEREPERETRLIKLRALHRAILHPVFLMTVINILIV